MEIDLHWSLKVLIGLWMLGKVLAWAAYENRMARFGRVAQKRR